jgi:uncharacterized membrane protein
VRFLRVLPVLVGFFLTTSGLSTRADEAEAWPTYRLRNLDHGLSAKGRQANTVALNSEGEVAGYWQVNQFRPTHPILWSRGRLIALRRPAGWRSCSPVGITDAGAVVGNGGGHGEGGPLIWDRGGQVHKIRVPEGWTGHVSAVNSTGLVVGGLFRGQRSNPATWRGDEQGRGTWTPIDREGVEFQALSDYGDAVGFDARDGVLWSGGRFTRLPVPDLTERLVPYAINNDGTVVGHAEIPADYWPNGYAFVYQHGVTKKLPTVTDYALASSAYGLNNHGIAVGDEDAAGGGEQRALLWQRVRSRWRVADLNTLIDDRRGFQIVAAEAINDRGQILARARRGGRFWPLRLDPR